MDHKQIVKEIEDVIKDYEVCRQSARNADLSDLPRETIVQISTRLLSAIRRYAPVGSAPRDAAEACVGKAGMTHWFLPRELFGVLNALKADYEAGYFKSVEELIHADLFSDFLEMAAHLLDQGYKDAAAVIIGSVLEEHLRKLCAKSGIDVVTDKGPKKADTLNAELTKGNVYNGLDQKSVTGWLDLRNKAAHGKYPEYAKEQVQLMLSGVTDFMVRHSA